jgi:hypothetical protein
MARPKRITSCATCSALFRAPRSTSTYCSRACRVVAQSLPLNLLLWPHVERTDTCWLFQGIATKDGYGRIVSQANGKRRMLRAHRIAWTLASGVEPTDAEKVCHTCDTPLCVRNDDPGTYVVKGIAYPRFGHLFLATLAANSQDRDAKGRNPNTFQVGRPHRYAIGEQSRSAKLTPALVREMRERRLAGETYEALGKAYGISLGSAWDVVRRKTWAHID